MPLHQRRASPELVLELAFRPLANALVPALLRAHTPPSAVVIANAAAGLCAALALARGELVLAALLLQLKTLLDNADGQLARAAGRVTLTGRYLDTEADLMVNAALFTALGFVTGEHLLALIAFLSLTVVLAADFNASAMYRETHSVATLVPASSGSGVERSLELIYRVVFAPQDRGLRSFSARRLERLLEGGPRTEAVTLAYHDRLSVTVLANLGLTTQLAVLGLCLVLDVPVVYLGLAVGCFLLLPLLQIQRERLAKRALGR